MLAERLWSRTIFDPLATWTCTLEIGRALFTGTRPDRSRPVANILDGTHDLNFRRGRTPTMSDDWKVIVVTGCTQGLGYHAVSGFAESLSSGKELPYQCVVLSCRNVPAAKNAAQTIAKRAKCEISRLVVLDEPCDLADVNSIRNYYYALKKFLGSRKIVSLVNNAGIGGNPNYRKSAQGFDQIWATNHLGHFLLTILCLPHLAENSRIVNVGSGVHDPAAKTRLPDADEFWPQVHHRDSIIFCGRCSLRSHNSIGPSLSLSLTPSLCADRTPRPNIPKAQGTTWRVPTPAHAPALARTKSFSRNQAIEAGTAR